MTTPVFWLVRSAVTLMMVLRLGQLFLCRNSAITSVPLSTSHVRFSTRPWTLFSLVFVSRSSSLFAKHALAKLHSEVCRGDIILPEKVLMISLPDIKTHEGRIKKRGPVTINPIFNDWAFSCATVGAQYVTAQTMLPIDAPIGGDNIQRWRGGART